MSEKQNILDELWLIIEEKSVGDDEGSYTRNMLNKDINHLARKMESIFEILNLKRMMFSCLGERIMDFQNK